MDTDLSERESMAQADPKGPEDLILLQSFVEQGDRKALGLLFTRHADAAYRFALRLAGRPADAEDVVQTAFIQVFHHAANFKGESAVKSWILGFVHNACRRKAREERRRKARQDRAREWSETVLAPTSPDPESQLLVQQAVQGLPEHYRTPIWLHYAEGLSPGEVADVLEVPENTVRKQLSRGLDRLREVLAPAGAALSVAAILPTLAIETAPSTLSASLHGIAASTVPASAAVQSGIGAKLVVCGASALLIASTATWLWWGEHQHEERPPEFAEIDRRVLEWQPSPDERRFDRIGWAPDLRTAERLSKESGRPVVLLTQSGRVNLGRTDGGSQALRASALSDSRVIDLLNGYFVPIYLSNVDYDDHGLASVDEKAEWKRIYNEAHDAGMPVGMDRLYVLGPADRRVLGTMALSKATSETFAAWLDQQRRTPCGEPLVQPTAQSTSPPRDPDDLVLHVTARYLDAKGEIEKKRANYHEFPAEDWIVLRPAEWRMLLSSGKLDPSLARRLFAAFHPLDMSVGQSPNERNHYDRTDLRVTVLSRSFARIEGELRMDRSFTQFTNPVDVPIAAPVKGYIEFDATRGGVRSLRIITEDATCGRNRFGVAVRSIP